MKNTSLTQLFKPMLTPKEMLQKGVFGGTYFSNFENLNEIDPNIFDDLDKKLYCNKDYDQKINCFKIKSGQSKEEWLKKGWIHNDDPRGWFEWYCKFYSGRIHEDDERQIKRWLAFCGPNGRWRNIIYRKIYNSGVEISFSQNLSIRIQQSLLHWSYIVNQNDFTEWKKIRNLN